MDLARETNNQENLKPGQRIRLYREKAKLTQSELSEKSGINKSNIHAYEADIAGLHHEWKKHREVVAKIATALGIDPDVIWLGSATPMTEGYLLNAGTIPCLVTDYAGRLMPTAAPSQKAVEIHADLSEWEAEALDVGGMSMAPRISHGDRIAVIKSQTILDGVLQIFRIGEMLLIGWPELRPDGWWAVTTKGDIEKITRENVVGLVISIEQVISENGYIVEVNTSGVRAVHPRIS